ncbi:YceD family protein [Sporosarcina obsidiansis]|uniref:YceD family protein n=1 Tax=Sporosarcina obsidiansis TaxID=2660748 RepID=UPI00129A8A53|nr:YceD family protein [Sporosarcina obsidiansis]
MKWSIHQLRKHRQGPLLLDEVVNLDSVKKRNDEIRAITPVRVSGTCSIGEKKLTCQLRLEGSIILPCARTWEDVDYPFSIESVEQFSWDPETLQTDDEIHPVEGEVIDFTPVLEELILLEIPMQVFCDSAEDRQQAEGKGWSYTTDEELEAQRTEEAEEKVDPRLAGLANFFETDKE